MEMYLQHNVTGVRNKPCVCTHRCCLSLSVSDCRHQTAV